MAETETPTRDAKLVQYLTEAYGKEVELQASLEAHIGMASAKERRSYKKKLQEHLKETKSHAKQLERRVKQLGGDKGVLDKAKGALTKGTGLAKGQVAAAKGPLHAIRGTSVEEKLLKAAKTEYWNEHEEIATYNAIETLAEAVNDKETAKLARDIRRDEEKMARYLERQIPTLTKAVVKAEIPAAERRKATAGKRRSSGGTRAKSRSTSARSNKSRSASSGSKSGSSSRSRSRSSKGSSSSSRRRPSGSRS